VHTMLGKIMRFTERENNCRLCHKGPVIDTQLFDVYVEKVDIALFLGGKTEAKASVVVSHNVG